MSALRGVIIDLDGTLIDSNVAHAQAWSQVLAEYGHTVTWEKVMPYIGMGGDHLLPKLTGIESDSEQGSAIAQRRTELFQSEYFPTLQPFPGVYDLVYRLKQAGLIVAIGTSATMEEAKKLITLARIEMIVNYIVTSSDAENSKPDPDIIHAALKKMECAADTVVMLGDTPYDIEAASKASVRTVALLCGGWEESDLNGAIACYRDPAHLLAQFDSSVFAPQES